MRERGRVDARSRARQSETGFTIVELLVVLIIIAIIFVIALPQIGRTRQKTGGPTINLAGGVIWRGVQGYRIDNGGQWPPTSSLTNAHNQTPPGSGWVNPGNVRYIKHWPEDASGRPIQVVAGAGAVPPSGSVAETHQWAGKVVYFSGGTSAWVVAYANTGAMVYRRSVGTSTLGPVG